MEKLDIISGQLQSDWGNVAQKGKDWGLMS